MSPGLRAFPVAGHSSLDLEPCLFSRKPRKVPDHDDDRFSCDPAAAGKWVWTKLVHPGPALRGASSRRESLPSSMTAQGGGGEPGRRLES